MDRFSLRASADAGLDAGGTALDDNGHRDRTRTSQLGLPDDSSTWRDGGAARQVPGRCDVGHSGSSAWADAVRAADDHLDHVTRGGDAVVVGDGTAGLPVLPGLLGHLFVAGRHQSPSGDGAGGGLLTDL